MVNWVRQLVLCLVLQVRTFLELGSFLKELPELPEDTQRAWDRVL